MAEGKPTTEKIAESISTPFLDIPPKTDWIRYGVECFAYVGGAVGAAIGSNATVKATIAIALGAFYLFTKGYFADARGRHRQTRNEDSKMNYLLAVQIALGILPQVLELIKAIEIPGEGAAKAKVIRDIVQVTLSTLPPDIQKKIPIAQIQAVVGLATDILVGYLNMRGVFGKKADPTPVPIPATIPEPEPTPLPLTIPEREAKIAELKRKLAAATDEETKANLRGRIQRNELKLAEQKKGISK